MTQLSFDEAWLKATRHHMAGRIGKARSSYEDMLAAWPGNPNVVELLSLAEVQAGQPRQAVALLEALLAKEDDIPAGRKANCLDILGQAQRSLHLPLAAAASFQAGLALDRRHVGLHNNLGIVLQEQGRAEDAVTCFQQAIAINPNLAEIHVNLGNAYTKLKNTRQAIASYRRALALAPRSPFALNNLGVALRDRGDLESATECFMQAFSSDSAFPELVDNLYKALASACDWRQLEAFETQLDRMTDDDLRSGAGLRETPFVSAMRSIDPTRVLGVARAWSTAAEQAVAGRRVTSRPTDTSEGARLRVGYLFSGSGNASVRRFLAHLRMHDHRSFDVMAYRYGENEAAGSAGLGKRGGGFRVADLGGLEAAAAAQRIADDGIGILVDLTPHLEGSRIDICALRPAPIQAAFLGFPGTTGARFFDYIITDRTVTPPSDLAFYDEMPVWLPHCVHVPDMLAGTAGDARAAAGAGPVVFGSFNHASKIDGRTFAAWTNILRRVPDSRLCLSRHNATARTNLVRAAEAGGIAPHRLVFEERFASEAERQAHRAAVDIVLDTRVNASPWSVGDALRAGVPVVTMRGNCHASRCSASVLASFGLGELVAPDWAGYEALAVDLAHDPARREAIRVGLRGEPCIGRIADPARSIRALEAGFRRMWELYLSGSRPQPIEVQDDADRRSA